MKTYIYNKAEFTAKAIFTVCLLLILPLSAIADNGNVVKGRVIDNDGNPLIGAVVNISEEYRMAVTDNDGRFTLKKVDATDELFVSLLGYESTRVKPVFNDDSFVIILNVSDFYAEEQPVAFSFKERRLTTEAISVVTGEELERHPVTVLQNAFTATLNGVETYEAQSEPGWSETAMYIRGIRTMNESARAPLVIVDNVERDLSFLDAYPIESITVLKDAASTAIYGMRGANGVILVTTKRGQSGKLKVDFTHELGFQTNAGIPETQNAYNYVTTVNQARYLDGLSPLYSDYDVEQYRRVSNGETLDGIDRYRYFNTNWHDVMLRDLAPQSRTNLQLSGGNNRARYYVSFSYLRQEGLFDSKWTKYNDDYNTQQVLNRYNLRVNVDLNVNKFLTVGLDLGGRIDNIVQPGIDIWNLFTWGAGENLPIYPIYCPNGEFFMPTTSDSKNGAAQIAGRGIEQNRRRNLYTTVTAIGDLSSLTPGLKANAVISFDSYETFQKVQTADINVFYYDFNNKDVTDVNDFTYQRMRTYKALPTPTTSPRDYYYNINTRFGLSYNRRFGDHLVDAQAFMRTYKNVVRGQNSSYRYLSWNAQAMYAYKDRYIANLSLSRMASDNFSKDNRWDTFPGVSVGWVASEEPFMKSIKDFVKLDMLKLRFSWGEAGQANTGTNRYPFQSTYASGAGYNFGTSQSYIEGAYESTAGNINNIWEKSSMVNFGVDIDIYKKLLYANFDVFKEKRSQILVSRSTIPTLFGLNAPQDSYGTAETKGFELRLGHINKIGPVQYHIEWNYTWNKNKITEMDELAPDFDYQAQTGRRIGQYFMYVREQWASDPNLIPTSHEDAIAHPEKYPYNAAGVYKLGNAVFKDVNGDRIINDYDRMPYGYSSSHIPETIHSINVGFEAFGFDARVIMTAYLNRTIECRENMDYGFGWGGTSTHEVTKTWGYYTDDPTDPRNINALYPRLSTQFSDIDRNYPYNQSNIWLRKGDFWSIRNIEVGYSLPKQLIAKWSLTKCRFYFSAYNIATFSDMENHFDPENPTNYIWAYPKTRSFSFGVNIGL